MPQAHCNTALAVNPMETPNKYQSELRSPECGAFNGTSRALTPDHMTEDEVIAWIETPAFLATCREVNARIVGGERMTAEEIAAALGLPWRVFADCLGLMILQAVPGAIVRIEDGPSAPVN